MAKQESKNHLSARTGLLILLVVLVVVLAFAYPQIKKAWQNPLGPGLEWPTETPLAQLPEAAPTSSPAPSKVPSEGKDTPGAVEVGLQATAQPLPASSLPPTDAPTPTPAPLCGAPPTMFVLGIGADSGQSYTYGLADVIRVLRADFVNAKVTMLTFPRDLWVQIPEMEAERGITEGKLNQSYFYGTPGMGYEGPGGGPGLLARTLDLNFGLRVDHYGAVNMQTFVKIVDAVGGVDVYLEEDVDGTPYGRRPIDLGYFNAGQQHLNGEAALRLARIRKRYSDFARQDHQDLVLCALREKVLSPNVLPKIPKIVAAFQDSVLTDLSPEQIGQLACLLPYVDRDDLIFTGFPDEIFESGMIYNPNYEDYTFALQADNEVVRDYVARFVAGTWPDHPNEPTCP